MSHHGEDGWFPECLVCGLGNVGPVVCLDPTCHEEHEGEVIADAREKYLDEAGHAWQLCQFCDSRVRSDGGAFGTHALCVDCWNGFAHAQLLPPTGPASLCRDIKAGVVTLGPQVTVKGPRPR